MDVPAAALGIESPLHVLIKRRVEETKALAGRRNDIIHSIIHVFQAARPPSIAAGGASRPSRLGQKEIALEVAHTYREIVVHQLDVHELRLAAIRHSNPAANLRHEERQLSRARQTELDKIDLDPIVLALLATQRKSSRRGGRGPDARLRDFANKR
ncbi:hypothetical protein [Bradyrhizobium sp. UNPA324]|uniref:hypothetical protein n=1 Tax=Bradyrhizobium sp. UNPA324 TaxID=1141174 RepID=UPI001153B542|nr:hypothetical protein [Bradyrhizobium sp. UNPA324]